MSRQITSAPRETIWDEIKEAQDKLSALYTEAGIYIFKETEGEAFLGEKNQTFGTYWASAVKQSPSVMSGEYNTADFTIKAPLFGKFVAVYNGHNLVGSLLATPYDILSKDVLRYSLDAQNAFKKSNKAVCKQAVKDSPDYRKLAPNAAKSTLEKTAERNLELAKAN